MGLEFLQRVIRATAVVGVLAFAFVAVYFNANFALGLLVGCAWGIGNFWALTRVVTAVFTPGDVDRRHALILAAVKFPVLYVAGYFILKSGGFPVVSLLTGFSVLFVVVVLKAAGRMFLHLDERASRRATRTGEPLETRV